MFIVVVHTDVHLLIPTRINIARLSKGLTRPPCLSLLFFLFLLFVCFLLFLSFVFLFLFCFVSVCFFLLVFFFAFCFRLLLLSLLVLSSFPNGGACRLTARSSVAIPLLEFMCSNRLLMRSHFIHVSCSACCAANSVVLPIASALHKLALPSFRGD